jgi:hypothetical protein
MKKAIGSFKAEELESRLEFKSWTKEEVGISPQEVLDILNGN